MLVYDKIVSRATNPLKNEWDHLGIEPGQPATEWTDLLYTQPIQRNGK